MAISVLAPMYDATDVVFRQIVAECAPPDLFVTEFVNVDGLQSAGRPKLIHHLARRPESDHKILAQIWGVGIDNFEKTAAELVEMGFDGIDINMGCPEKNVVKNNCCSGLINDPKKASDIIRSVQKGSGGAIPVSVKTRLGFNQIDLNWTRFLLGHNLDMLTMHFRTRKEMSEVDAHWELAPEIVTLRNEISPHTTIIGNGDIVDRDDGESKVESNGLDGYMIGRGVFHNPYCFAPDPRIWDTKTSRDRIDLYTRHVELFINAYAEGQRSPQTLKRFCKVYINSFDGATELRTKLMDARSAEELLHLLHKAAALQ